LPTYFAGTPAQFHNEILGGNRIIATLFGIFGAVAFVLSAVGLYGVMSFSVTQRTQEFGIRMALGADAARIFRMVMTQGAWHCFSEFSPPLLCRTFSSRSTRSIPSFISRLQECSLSSRRHLASFPHAAPPRSIQWSHCDTSDVVAKSISEQFNHYSAVAGLLTAVAAASCLCWRGVPLRSILS
jgi:hypothetical protein